MNKILFHWIQEICQITNFEISTFHKIDKTESRFLCFDGDVKLSPETESTHARTELAWLAGFSWHSTQSALCQKLKTKR